MHYHMSQKETHYRKIDIGGLVQDWSQSSALVMELVQSCATPSI